MSSSAAGSTTTLRSPRRGALAGVWICVCALTLPSLAGARSIDVTVDRETARMKSHSVNGVTYISLESLFRLMGSRAEIDWTTQHMTVELAGHRWQFWGNSGMIGRDEEVYVLGDPVRELDGELCAPITELAALIDRYGNRRMEWQPENDALVVSGGRYNVTGYKIERRDNGILIEFALVQDLPYEVGHSEGNWINLTIHNARIETGRFQMKRRRGAVREMRAYQFESSVQISVRMGGPFERYFASVERDPTRLALVVLDEGATTQAASRVASPTETRMSNDPIDVVIIDPGHGGDDQGATGQRDDWTESAIALSVAQFIADEFDGDDDLKVVLTRDSDHLTTTAERAIWANEHLGDLFISIHVNSSPNPNDQGSQTFFYAPAVNPDGISVADRENASALAFQSASGDGGVAMTTQDLARHAATFQAQSAELARMIEDALEKRLPVPGRGVDQAELEILAYVEMPAIVVECAYISNPKEDRLLRRESFHRDVARAIADGIRAYRDKADTPR